MKKAAKFDSFSIASECFSRQDCIDTDILRRVVKSIESSDYSYDKLLGRALEVTRCTQGEGVESCVLNYLKENRMISASELQKSVDHLKPFGPRNNTKWLSDSNIDNICKLFEHEYPAYKHLGVVMSDLFFVGRGRKLLTPESFERWAREGKKYISAVFNTDVSSGGGQHWFCLFVEMESPETCKSIELFDSQRNEQEIKCMSNYEGPMGDAATGSYEGCLYSQRVSKIYDLCRRIQDHFGTKKRGGGSASAIVVVTDGNLQKNGSECGVYSIYYIYNRLKGVFDGQRFAKDKEILDDQMVKFRKNLFSGVDLV